MSMKKVGSIEVYELDENLDKYTRKEREEYINELFKQEYQGKEISYFLNGEEIKALINKTTKKNFFVKKHSHGQKESSLEFNTRQDIVFSGDYENLIKNSQYDKSSKDNYIGFSKNHTDSNEWHYFKKSIVCNGIVFDVIIDVRERYGKYILYNIKLKEVDYPTINRGYTPTSSVSNIS